jgi:hypothetical protein
MPVERLLLPGPSPCGCLCDIGDFVGPRAISYDTTTWLRREQALGSPAIESHVTGNVIAF